ncbi:MAG: DNA recombination protein RmuC [Candidatus Sungbacteria bacterium]|nr:DNA recombination protein RmuC [Candidatus Sungbacteria bacterium]
MELIFLIVIVVVLTIGFAGFFFALRKRAAGKEDTQAFLMLQSQVNEISRVLDQKLGESTQVLQKQFGESVRIIRDVTERLTKLDETNRQVVGVADQLKGLEDILKNPKQRGIFGEYQLETLLKNVFPPGMYKMQYDLGVDEKSGERLIPDAVIFVKDKIIPIDSKFSLENYNRIIDERDLAERERLERVFKQDLKDRIDETSKYVRPDLGTMDFAFMFIPAEGIYYDLLVNKVGAVKTSTRDLIEYAFIDKKVHIVSPTTLLSHLKMVMQGLRALQIEESAKEIGKRVGELGKHIAGYEGYMKKLGGHLGTTVNIYNTAYKELGKIDKDVLRITGDAPGIEAVLVSKPADEEEG